MTARPSHRPPETFLTVAEAADVLRVSKMTVLRIIHAGEMPAHRIGRSIRIRERDFDAYLRGADMSPWTHDGGAA